MKTEITKQFRLRIKSIDLIIEKDSPIISKLLIKNLFNEEAIIKIADIKQIEVETIKKLDLSNKLIKDYPLFINGLLMFFER